MQGWGTHRQKLVALALVFALTSTPWLLSHLYCAIYNDLFGILYDLSTETSKLRSVS